MSFWCKTLSGVIACLTVWALSASVSLAQDDGGQDPVFQPPGNDAGGAGDQGGGDAPAAGGNGKANESESSSDSAPSQNRLVAMFTALGLWFSPIFLALSFILVALIVMNIMTARRDAVVPIALVEDFDALLEQKKYQDAYELAKQDESVLGQVLSAGLAKASQGYEEALEAMQEVGEEENMKMEHRLSYMALIGTISPMIGLFGTVAGMIGAFDTLGGTAAGAPPATELAKDIATALWTTFVGLAIAIPAIAAYNIMRNRAARLMLEVGIISENLMSRVRAGSGGATT
ncbi:MAG: MotA/TolQ/ExbB proton channel family protein [Pirellulales bacterium]|nr:MotA/TolQ/ExbB proton channel family protein [Pirellulales bacterium]